MRSSFSPPALLRSLRCLAALALLVLPSAALAQGAPPSEPPAYAPPAVPASAVPQPQAPALEPPSIRRFYIKARPFVGIYDQTVFETSGRPAGVQLDFGFDHSARRGVWVGIESSPFVLSNITGGIPIFGARLTLGYSGLRFALGANVSTSFLSAAFLQIGPSVRIGRLTGTHARFRFSFPVLYPVLPFPVSGDLELNIKARRRVWVHINIGGDLAIGGLYSTFGAQILLRGNGGRGSDLLTVGAGVTAILLDPGPMITLGYERRF